MAKDPEAIAEAKKAAVLIQYVDGPELQRMVAEFLQAPAPLAAALTRFTKPGR